jgi:hypothetical protein
MPPSTLKYLYSVEPVRMHFSAKQPCTNDTVCNAAMQHCTQYQCIRLADGRKGNATFQKSFLRFREQRELDMEEFNVSTRGSIEKHTCYYGRKAISSTNCWQYNLFGVGRPARMETFLVYNCLCSSSNLLLIRILWIFWHDLLLYKTK